ncbi:MAG: alpha/beta hydrolase [Puia sp.]|nr:alpha/beta hydrolase [Puia sp.]
MRKKWLLLIPVLLIILYLSGPTPASPSYNKEMPAVPSGAKELEDYIKDQEAKHVLKPDNEARIVWANDSLKQPTEYSIVYLHGFSSSQGEGDPTHRYIARKFGCNLYLSRLAEHGIDTVDALINLTAEAYWESAKQALAIGRQLGRKVILMGTSTGGTQALQLAATYPDQVAALVLLSPNIAINDPNAWLLNNHWGLQIAHLVVGSKYIDSKDTRPLYRQYWYSHYRTEGVAALEEMLETTMNKETFEKVKQPVELLYYYKDSVHQDSTVKVSASLAMFDQLGTPAALKYKQAIPNAGNHVIGSSLRSGDVPGVEREISKFLEEILHLPVVAQ